MRKVTYDATKDITEHDEVQAIYKTLWSNKFKSEADREIEVARQRDFRKSWKYAAMDMAVGVLIMILVGLIVCLPALLERS